MIFGDKLRILNFMDFTFSAYELLLKSLFNAGFSFLTYGKFLNDRYNVIYPSDKIAILRHDVEDKYINALKIAAIEHNYGIQGSYYFRIYLNRKNHQSIIQSIAALGHEIGYHYDDLSFCKGDVYKAVERFVINIKYLRQFGPVETITMEGAPLSQYDNKNLWKTPLTSELVQIIQKQVDFPNGGFPLKSANQNGIKKNGVLHYSLFGIKGEPYFDLDYNSFYYITDTGRRWDGFKYSVRDKMPGYHKWIEQGHIYHSTHDIIKAVQEKRFPNKVMITIHPQRWNDKPFPWFKEWVGQNFKNVFKFALNKIYQLSGK